MAWDAARKSHDGLIAAGYRGPWANSNDQPATCKFCNREIVWYMTPNTKLQPFTAGTFEPHHGDCPEYAEMRRQQKEAAKKATA